MSNLNFGDAIAALKQGKLVQRSGWNGKNMFLFIRPEFICELEQFERIQSIPDATKTAITKAIQTDKYPCGASWEFKFTPYISMFFAADRTIVNGWLASQTDMLAEDWQIIQ